jgi:hypothetical protein
MTLDHLADRAGDVGDLVELACVRPHADDDADREAYRPLGGIDGLAAAMLVALIVATPIGGWAAFPALADPVVLLAAIGVGIASPLFGTSRHEIMGVVLVVGGVVSLGRQPDESQRL